MKKPFVTLLVLSMLTFFGYGCDTGSSNGICTESVSGIGSTSAAKLYYPCDLSGATGATTMSSGWTGGLEDIEWLSQRVSEAGFVVLAFTPANRYGMVSQWRDAHKNTIARLKSINSSHAALKGKIDTNKLNTCGHSKGGGGSLWASSQLTGQLKTTVGMAPYREEFSNNTLGTITAATFIQAGAGDTLATNSMTRGEYGGLGNISKKYVEYTGYDHMAWANASGTSADRMAGDIIAWMKYYMNGDTSQKNVIADRSGTSNFEWVDLGNGGSGSGGSTGGEGDTFNGTYSIVAVHSGKALDTWEWGTTDGTNIVQYDYWGGEAQQFIVTPVDGIWHRITPLIASDQALDVAGCVADDGANIQTWTYWGGNCQQFRFNSAGNGAYQIIARNSNMCLNVLNGSQNDGANVVQYTCTDGAQHQLFEMVQK